MLHCFILQVSGIMAGLSGSSGTSTSFFNVMKSQTSGGDATVTSLVDAKPKKDAAEVIPTPTPKDNKLPNQPAKVAIAVTITA